MNIKPITNPEDYIRYYPWIKDLNYSDMTPPLCLSRCLSGQYKGLLGLKKDKPVGIVIYWTKGDFCFVVGLWCKNNLSGFQNQFWDMMKNQGIKTVRSSTTRPEEAYGRLMGMKKLWTVYERKL